MITQDPVYSIAIYEQDEYTVKDRNEQAGGTLFRSLKSDKRSEFCFASSSPPPRSSSSSSSLDTGIGTETTAEGHQAKHQRSVQMEGTYGRMVMAATFNAP